ncbi:MAG: cytochrome c [Magnetococcales bacterium]|nr:cytochrome c [Magnetococcales bacterium]
MLLLAPWQGVQADDRHAAGRAIYNFRCYYCHGYSGDARTLAATFLQPVPRNFSTSLPDEWPLERLQQSILNGVPNTAMMGFATVLTAEEIALVAGFVREEFMVRKAENTRYHIASNGWANHERYADAYPFARGDLPLDRPDEALNPEQRRGKILYLNACISCHDRGRVEQEGPIWETRAVSYPRAGYTPGQEQPLDALAAASVHARHDLPPVLTGEVHATIRQGEHLFQKNCAFCHAADGTGKNWIGQFLEPHPRNLTDPAFMKNQTTRSLARVIASGLPGTSMPAWKSVLTPAEIEAVAAYIGHAFHPLAADSP